MTNMEIIKYASWLLGIYQGMRRLIEARGMSPDEFDEQVRTEARRLDGYGASVDGAVANVFAGK